MVLMAGDKKVLGFAIGGNEFLRPAGQKTVASLPLDLSTGQMGNLKYLWIDKSTKLRDDSALTIQDLIDKDKEPTMIVTMAQQVESSSHENVMVSEPLKLNSTTNPGSPNAHRFNWISEDDSTNTWIDYTTPAQDASGQLSTNAFIIGSNTLSNQRDNFGFYFVTFIYPYGAVD